MAKRKIPSHCPHCNSNATDTIAKFRYFACNSSIHLVTDLFDQSTACHKAEAIIIKSMLDFLKKTKKD